MRLITNRKENNHTKILKELFRVSEEVFIAVAFFKKSGFDLISKDFNKSLERGTKITFVCGLDFYQTEPDALRAIYSLTQKYDKCKLLIQEQDNKSTFHPKLYCFRKGGKRTIIIGSANFTKGGFESNYELSIKSTFETDSEKDKEVLSLINGIKNNCIEYSDIEISNYARKYQIYKRNENSAKRNSNAETDALFQLNKDRLKKYLDKYKRDITERDDLKRRTENYQKAKEILEGIRTQNLTKSEFFSYYEKLVGKAGEKSLWHSGSIFRGKESVKEFHKEFKVMLNEIFDNINSTPSEILKKVEKYYRVGNKEKIDGIGPNIMTEILNTYAPDKFAVLNQNPLTSIKYLGFEEFPHSQSFRPKNYRDFTVLLSGIKNGFNFESLGQVDHFLNYIYWQVKNENKN